MEMEFRALGPLTIQRDGEEVDLGSHKQQAVLALLLINANQSLSVDRILEEIWGDDGDGKVNALHVYVSRLRSALEPNRRRGDSSVLETVGSGYRLNVDLDRFDVARFEREVAEVARSWPPTRLQPPTHSGRRSARGTAPRSRTSPTTSSPTPSVAARATCALHVIEDRIEADLARGLSGELVSELDIAARTAPAPRASRQPPRPGAVSSRSTGGSAAGDRPVPSSRRRGTRYRSVTAAAATRRAGPAARRQHPAPSSRPRPRRPDRVRRHQPVQGPASVRAVRCCDVLRSRRPGRRDPARPRGGQRLVALVGASGSGKSSVVRAGLIPALAKGAIDGSDSWLVATMMPGAHPFAELEGALLRSTIDSPESLSELLAEARTPA